jgi:16S rRNA (uracil1498-N3)-methyltransferase
MKVPTFYCESLSASRVILSESEAHHANKVMRVKVGDACFLINSIGERASGKHLKNNQVEIVEIEVMPRPFGQISWLIPFLVPEDLKVIIQAATPLGIETCFIVQTQFTQKSNRDLKKVLIKLAGVAQTAQKMASIPYVPKVVFSDLETVVGNHQSDILVFHQEAVELTLPKIQKNILLCFGPEGGFSDGEIALFLRKKASVVSLGYVNYRSTLAPLVATLASCNIK